MNHEIVKEFTELAKLDNPSLDERQVADHILRRLRSMGFSPQEDDAGEKNSGTTGNILCEIPGDPEMDGILFASHMDSVAPCTGKTIVVDDEYIQTDQTTVLGSDDLAGASCMLELARSIRAGEVKGGTVWLLFTIAEEIGLLGAKSADLSMVDVPYAFVLDSNGEIGTASISSPSHNTLDITVIGKAAHSGIEPEKGINAIQVAARAIDSLEMGRIDEETTSNIGIIEGGKARNIVCETVLVKAECRSRSESKLETVTKEIGDAFQKACQAYHAECVISVKNEYKAITLDPDSGILEKFKKACVKTGLPCILEHSGGGSDTNIIHAKGIPAVNISVGMENVHSVKERIKIKNLVLLSGLLKALVEGELAVV
ncbi:MAG: M20/M25/M40 family metallo-hydrolase [Clostridia bacterium]